ncbi:MAG: asparagine synthase (glutamine-hydrolyzing), partial [Steroidobacteraceae bacterium]
RGPDDQGEWWSESGKVGFGHRRLAVIDLSPAGHQPMLDAGGDYCVVFNGEIYNYRDLRNDLLKRGHEFRSDSDTEVLLAAYREWGADCLARLNGMFSFALYDGLRDRVLIARDRAGEKPLFYSLANGELRFASELKALMADDTISRRIDPEALDCYLAMGYVPGHRCMLKGFRKLPAAHALMFDLASANCRVWRYWQLPALTSAAEGNPAGEAGLLDELEALLEDAVRRQLVADVPVGVLLSGGLDSSLIAAMAVRSGQSVKTFTVRFPGFAEYDESEHARLVARHFGTVHVELDAGAATVDLLPVLARQVDEPMADSSLFPTFLVSRLARQHCTVALGGEGGDELFGGYLHYGRQLRMQRKLRALPLGLRRYAAKAAEAMLPAGFRGRNWLQQAGIDAASGVASNGSYFDRQLRRKLMARDTEWPLTAEAVRAESIPAETDPLQRSTRYDFESYLADDILVKVDRASMLSSLEVRAPMLDYRVVEFAFGRIPSSLKATTRDRKVVLKRLAARVLPPEFNRHRKQGFSIPLASWLRTPAWRQFFHDVLLESRTGLICKKTAAELLQGQAKGRSNSERLFALVMLELWQREYAASL